MMDRPLPSAELEMGMPMRTTQTAALMIRDRTFT